MSKKVTLTIYATIISLNVLGAPRLGDVELNDTSSTRLKEIEVSANRLEKLTKSAVPAQEINSTRILTDGIIDISDAMHRIAGINLRDYGGAGGSKTASIRGLGAQHTGVIYDGVSLSDMQSGQMDLSRYSLDNLSNIRLNIGDANDIFEPARTASSAANLSLNTIQAPELLSTLPNFYVKIKGGSFSTFNPSLRFSKSNGSNFAFSINTDYLYSLNNYPFTLYNGTATKREERANALINKVQAEGSIIWKPLPSHTLRAKIYFYDNYRQLPGPVIYYASPSNERLHDRNAFAQLIYVGKLSDHFSLKAIGKYNNSVTRYKDTNGKYSGGEINDYYLQNEEYISSALLYRCRQNFQLNYAADYFHNQLSESGWEKIAPDRNSFLQCLSATYKISRLNAVGRLLWSNIWDNDGKNTNKHTSRLTPSVSLSWQVVGETEFYLRASYKNIFRMPTFNELYFRHNGTINLQPELTEQFNLGILYMLPQKGILENFMISTDFYHNNIKDKIVAIPFNMFLWTMTNMGKAISTGTDITIQSEINLTDKHHLVISGNYSYLRAVSRTKDKPTDWNKQLPYTPLNSGAWSLGWLNPWVNIVLHGSGCSSRYSTTSNMPETRIGGYMETGITLYKDFRYKRSNWGLRADIANIFDKQYEIVRRYPMPGRAFSISLSYEIK